MGLIPPMNECLQALGRLEFDKRFLVSSIIPEENVEERLTVYDIRRMEHMQLEEIEAFLRGKEVSRIKRTPETSSSSHVYFCMVYADRRYTLKGPVSVGTKSPLQRAFGDDKILIVRFDDDVMFRYIDQLHRRCKTGILVGLRVYKLLLYKDSQGLSLKGYYVCTTSMAENDRKDPHFERFRTIKACKDYLMHLDSVSTLPLYNKRMQLVVSKTMRINADLSQVNIEQIDDVVCKKAQGEIVRDPAGKPLIHTDGCGCISVDLARKCPRRVKKGQQLAASYEDEEYPLVLQVRVFHEGKAIKGTLLANRQLPPNTIQYRPSMLKVNSNGRRSQTYDALELCSTSIKPREGRLSQYIVALLSRGGVPAEVFIEMSGVALLNTQTALHNVRAALKLCFSFLEWDERAAMIIRMIGVELPLQDPFIQKGLRQMILRQMEDFKHARIPIPNCYNLMGTADVTGTLKRSQIAVILHDGPIFCSKVLVYKHPGIHPGDVRCFEATWNEKLQEVVGNGKYAVIFPVQGERSVVDEIANSDLDGDIYWICTNEQLVNNFEVGKPWTRPDDWEVSMNASKPTGRTDDEVEDFVMQKFLSKVLRPSCTAGICANAWLAHMDQYLYLETQQQGMFSATDLRLEEELGELDKKMKALVDLNYRALDSEKTGAEVMVPKNLLCNRKPHFMQKNDEERKRNQENKLTKKKKSSSGKEKKKSVYCRSTSVLGQIYDLVSQAPLKYEPEVFQHYPSLAYGDYRSHKAVWKERFDTYRSQMSTAIDGNEDRPSKNGIISYYRTLLFGAENFQSRTKQLDEILEEASAVYEVVYDYAVEKRSPESNALHFAWTVAGVALCEIHSYGLEDEAFKLSANILNAFHGRRQEMNY